MAFREGLGPVYAFEWLTSTRRWQLYAWRSAFVGFLLVGMVSVWISHSARWNDLDTIKGQAEIAGSSTGPWSRSSY